MRKIRNLLLLNLFSLCLLFPFSTNAQTPAFPGAEGFGKYATGGRGGRVVEVTNLEDRDRYGNYPEGSLRWALNTAGVDPITVVFKVSGIIELTDELKSSRSNMTIAGQTAPGDGICIKDYSVKLSGENLIIRYIRFRPGDETGTALTSCLNIENSRQIIVDHCSMSWSIEENMGFYDNDSTTVQYCILSESLNNSYHPKGNRGYAAQWGGQWASYHHNLIAHHRSRSPRFNGSHSNDYFAVQDFRNNVVYNYGHAGAIYGGENELFADTNSDGNNDAGSFINFAYNYMKPGPNYSGGTFVRPSLARDGVEPQGYAQWYVEHNIIDGFTDITENNWWGVDGSEVNGRENIRVDIPHKVDSVTTSSAEEAYTDVLNNAGAIMPIRDEVDSRVINDVKNGTGGLIDAVSDVGGWPEYKTPIADSIPADTDKDGMPDYWETENSLDPNDPADGNGFDLSSDGYTNLEVYLNSDIPYIDPSEPSNSVSSENVKPLEIFPNPCKDIIHFSLEYSFSSLQIFTLNGQLILNENIKTGQSSLSVESLNSGIYLVRAVTFDGTTYNAKINKL